MQRLDNQRLIKKAKEIATSVLAKNVDQVDKEAIWPQEGIQTLQKEGFGGLVIPQAYGGQGQGLLTLAKVCEALGEECASTAICYGMHCVGSSVISVNATEEQQDKFITPICNGQHITSLSLSESGSGAHFYLPQSTLEQIDEDQYLLNGTKAFVTNGGQADSYVVSVVAAESESQIDQFSCVVVPSDTDGISWGEKWDGLGMRGNSSRIMELKNVMIPRNNLLGKEGDQIWYIFNVVTPYFLIAMAGTFLGVASSALEVAKKHLTRRYHTHTGSSLAQANVLQHRLGTLWAMLERTRQLTYHAATSFDHGEPDAMVALMAAKVEVADCVVNLVNEVMTLTGGISYRNGSKLDRSLRDARAAHLMSPTTEILRVWIGRAVLGLALLAD